jgi:folylpolyglutamate synthase/dihydropteroate synthase
VATTTETIRNGVDTAQLYGTLDAIKADPSIAKFQFRAQNRWIDGAHNRSTIKSFYAARQEDSSRTD